MRDSSADSRTAAFALLSSSDERFLPGDGLTTVGRDPHNDLVILESSVSRRHATLSIVRGRVVLRDCGSFNGTYVGERRVRDARVLKDGDQVRFGEVSFVFMQVDSAAKSGSVLGRWVAWTVAAALACGSLGFVAAFASHHATSSEAARAPGTANFLEAQSCQVPGASSDFIGDWCGWERIVSCSPARMCGTDPVPNSVGFRRESGWFSDAGGIVMRYSIVADPGVEVGHVNVRAVDAHQVEVESVTSWKDAHDGSRIDERDDLVSLGPAAVRLTESASGIANGAPVAWSKLTEMRKCSAEFDAAENKFIKEHKWEEKAQVSSGVPAK